ncbi:hypothetical protein DFA_09015 [Cavenderia fasciculata]|uniref:Uncharacterized protein n=1 Tax=Cavenderia fasciculata TaxID=261658 RepID=F4Q6G7_CACFS|nr:uncharacterized protein DFA_09015 [Cavenderia fasciculata]EGG16477.1 hypothetical protein DFA_09015 [Cavenderia fasciculata]|eukprot:XP_004354877.1 hypothetical protein DFA_09015 [Cavenderia fasciculata]
MLGTLVSSFLDNTIGFSEFYYSIYSIVIRYIQSKTTDREKQRKKTSHNTTASPFTFYLFSIYSHHQQQQQQVF